MENTFRELCGCGYDTKHTARNHSGIFLKEFLKKEKKISSKNFKNSFLVELKKGHPVDSS